MLIIDILASFLIAALAGLGVGGGGLLVLYLVMFREMEQLPAQGINLLFFISAAAASLFLHSAKRRLDFRLIIGLAIGGIIGAVGGAAVASAVDPNLVRHMFGWLLIVSGVLALFRSG